MENSLGRNLSSKAPDVAGVYRFTSGEKTIYVGKAKSLKKRLKSYFVKEIHAHPRTAKMIQLSEDINWVVCKTEEEALVLERSWIQSYKPVFNVALKEAGHHPRIQISNETYPSATITYKSQGSGELFGPWPGVDMKKLLDSITHLTGIRSCYSSKYKTAIRTQKPCLLFDLGKCSAPCTKPSTNYQLSVNDTRKILKGETSADLTTITDNMLNAANDENFELAALWRDRMNALQYLNQTQSILQSKIKEIDVLVVLSGFPYSSVAVARIRDGFIQSVNTYITDQPIDNSLYSHALTLFDSPDAKSVTVLSDRIIKGEGRKYKLPRSLEEKRLYEFVLRNASEALRYGVKSSNTRGYIDQAINSLSTILSLPAPPYHIECIDIAHTQGTLPVASVVSLLDGLEDGVGTRRYIIPDSFGGKDPQSINWTVLKRYRPESDGTVHRGTPDLLLIDGGQPQLSAAKQALEELGIEIPIFGLAKKEEEVYKTDGSMIILPLNSPELLLLRRVRDYAHKTANSYHAQRRGKNSTISILSKIPGIGVTKQNTLLDSFTNIESMANASVEQLSNLPGIGIGLAEIILDYLKPWRQNIEIVGDTENPSHTVLIN